MNLYYELLGKPVFSVKDLKEYYDNEAAARSALKRLIRSGQVLKIRQSMYTCRSGENGGPVANRFQIASAVTETSFVSHHSAMEYYGITDQVFYEVYVGSAIHFRNFEFDGYTYRCVLSGFSDGIEKPEYSGGICVTDRERTIIDSIRDMNRIAGPEEVISNIFCMKMLDEKKLLHYLELYDNQFLYQKTGLILHGRKKQLGLSDEFFAICRKKIGKSKRYIATDYVGAVHYDEVWQLVVPDKLFHMKNGEG